MASGSEQVGEQHEQLTRSVPYRVRSLDFTAFQDSDTTHEGNCGSGPVDSETTSDAAGGDCDVGWTHPGEWLEYSIQVASAGKYNLTARVASALTGKTLRLSVDGQSVGGSLSVPSSGWQAFADRTVKDVNLTAGTHTLRVTFETGDTNLNYIDVAPGAVALPARIEAESYQRANESTPKTNSGNGCDRGDGVDKELTGDVAGGGCNVGWTTAGEWLEYDVSVPQPGPFDLTLRVGSGVTGHTNRISIDGVDIGTISVPNVGWTAFQDRTLANVNLAAGAHVLRVTFVEGDTNLNYLNIDSRSTSTTPVVANASYSFGAAVDYNLFLFQDLSSTPDIAGPIAVGRDVTAQAFGYNKSVVGSLGVVVGRNFNGANGSVHRDLVYGNTATLNNVGVLDGGTSIKANPIDFAGEKAKLTALSTQLAALPVNGKTTIYPYATIDFAGSDPGRNVFTVNGAALGATDVLRLLVPSSSTVVINVTGTNASFDTTGIQMNGLSPGHLIWNFPAATSVSIAQSGLQGTLLAVNAAVTQSSATLNGVLIASSLNGGDSGLTWAPFTGAVASTCPDGSPNCAGTVLPPIFPATRLDCYAPNMSGTLSGSVYSSLKYVPVNTANGICAPTFCDASGNTVATPTEAQLNTAPPAGSICSAFSADAATCPIDPTTLTNACTTDADCTGGAVCAGQCVDTACTEIRHVCGKRAVSCGLPAQDNCDEFRLCPQAGAVGVPNKARLESQLTHTTAVGASATVPEAARDLVLPTYIKVDDLVCDNGATPLAEKQTTEDASSKPADDGSKQWGVYLEPTSDFSLNPVKRTDGISELEIKANGGVAAGGILLGQKLEVLSADIGANLTDCGVKLNGTLKFLGQAVVSWTSSVASKLNLASSNDGTTLSTPDLKGSQCKTAREEAKTAMANVRQSNLLARAAKEYYAENGLTESLCLEIKEKLPSRAKDANGQPLDCHNLSSVAVADQIKIVNAWRDEYTGEVGSYPDFSTKLGSAQQGIQTTGNIDVFNSPHPYHATFFDQDFPIGPVTLNIAVEGYGAWSIDGAIQWGVGFSGDFKNAGELLKNSLKGESPNIGDIRAFAGPVIAPGLQVGVQLFVGVGIPGVSIGLQGNIDLLDITLPTGIVAAAERISTADQRSLAGTDYAGTPSVGFAPMDYRWITGFEWMSTLNLTELRGEVDLALRIHLLFFHHTFKQKLFSFPGFTQSFPLISGGTSTGNCDNKDSAGMSDCSLEYSNDYGKQADNVAYTPVDPINEQPKLNLDGPGRFFPGCSPVVK
ncbi:MAG TPA: choice-of-anchor A family protein [Polyangiaceae bacterium]|nr:choice-of-anchor A family protein [Polyangiaceae bacterium]